MDCYIIFYYGRSGEPEYFQNRLINSVLEHYDNSYKIIGSNFFILTKDTAIEIRNNLNKNIHPKDGLLVIRSGTESAWSNIDDSDTKWLKENL